MAMMKIFTWKFSFCPFHCGNQWDHESKNQCEYEWKNTKKKISEFMVCTLVANRL